MNQLLPIIRRKRRPLILEDVPPAVAGNVEPVKAVAATPTQPVVSETAPTSQDANAAQND